MPIGAKWHISFQKSDFQLLFQQNDTSTLKLFPFLLLISDELVFFVLDKVFKTVSL